MEYRLDFRNAKVGDEVFCKIPKAPVSFSFSALTTYENDFPPAVWEFVTQGTIKEISMDLSRSITMMLLDNPRVGLTRVFVNNRYDNGYRFVSLKKEKEKIDCFFLV